jgi:AcrR family transcriptional regulator
VRDAASVTPVPEEKDGPVTARGEGTRARIVDAAMRLFEERGYEKTTMRAVAGEAGVSLGNAYYYFASKDELVQGFYHRIQEQHALAAGPRMRGLTAFAERLTAAELAFVDVAEPYHQFAGRFFAVAADPASPLSPFSQASREPREASQRIFTDVVSGSDLKADARVLQELPELLWLAHLGLVLRWVHDRSEGQAGTRTLIRRAVPLIDRLARLSRLRPLRPVVHEILDLAGDLRPR